jgi:hypothetical protein
VRPVPVVVGLELSLGFNCEPGPVERGLEVIRVAEASIVVRSDVDKESVRSIVEKIADDPFLHMFRIT